MSGLEHVSIGRMTLEDPSIANNVVTAVETLLLNSRTTLRRFPLHDEEVYSDWPCNFAAQHDGGSARAHNISSGHWTFASLESLCLTGFTIGGAQLPDSCGAFDFAQLQGLSLKCIDHNGLLDCIASMLASATERINLRHYVLAPWH